MASKANGALMRITSLAVWGHKLSQRDLVAAAAADAQLTHPNKVCLVSSPAFLITYTDLDTDPMERWRYAQPCRFASTPFPARSTSSCTDTTSLNLSTTSNALHETLSILSKLQASKLRGRPMHCTQTNLPHGHYMHCTQCALYRLAMPATALRLYT